MKTNHFYGKLIPKTQNKPQFTKKKPQPNELVQNFITALNTNSGLSQKYSSQSSTTISDQESLEDKQNRKIGQTFKKIKKVRSLLTQYQCLQNIQNSPNQLISSTTYEFREQIQKLSIDPIYFVKHQGIKTTSRSILMDWITQVCTEFNFLRQTCQVAKVMIDSYLSCTARIPLKLLQLVGVTCLLISCKLQQSLPKSVVQMAYATACLYNINQIKQFQMEILTKLKFRVRFLTYDQCINFLLNQWKKYEELNINQSLFNLTNDQTSILSLNQSLKNSESLNHNYLTLSLGLFVLLIGYHNGWYSFDEIQYSFIYNSRYLLNSPSYFLNKMQKFLNSFNIQLLQLTPALQFVSSYLFLIQIDPTKTTFQTHNKSCLQYLKFRKQLVKEMEVIFE